jgi:hypothetical protein
VNPLRVVGSKVECDCEGCEKSAINTNETVLRVPKIELGTAHLLVHSME